jgi:hypothetical protein
MMNRSQLERALPWSLLALALALAPLLWAARGRIPQAGSTIDTALTLITADKPDLSCALAIRVDGLHCRYRTPTQAWSVGESSTAVLQPFVSSRGATFLVSDLFAQPALAQRYALELPDGKPRTEYRRFTAECRFRLVQRVSGAQVQFGRDAVWAGAPELWVARPVSCRVSG